MDLDSEDVRTALEFAIEPLEVMQLDERVKPLERQACDEIVGVIKELLEGKRG